MIRFQNGVPQKIWYSQHSNGEAFTYAATEKYASGVRPVVYSANGSHANYAIPGTHDHTIPNLNLPVRVARCGGLQGLTNRTEGPNRRLHGRGTSLGPDAVGVLLHVQRGECDVRGVRFEHAGELAVLCWGVG